MRNFYRSSLIGLLLLIPATGHSLSSIKDADAVVTIRNGNACFSYPQDEEVRNRAYSVNYLAVSKNGPVGGSGWEIAIDSTSRKGLKEPNSPATCIEYGVSVPGITVKQTAEPLVPETPYKVFIRISEISGGRSINTRKYMTDFCLSSNEKGEPVIVEAVFDKSWNCLKPGEIRKRGFWESLFGK